MTKGAYQLLIRVESDSTVTVGKLGTFVFRAGYYVYTGSAMGGIEARVARHLSREKKFHWHIDYLLEHGRIIRYAIREGTADLECRLNGATVALPGAQAAVRGFGSSDCRCASHLVYLPTIPERLPAESSLSTDYL